ncbi:hypothetical protein CXG81DRAFT_20951 [Caulochytrium protostelioides]|uniref:Rho-GAP domain-containing protein n=1 Tax=Caulochytrium protostelioides TaxID=1555241 RepID=A0A4P9X1Q9_9FUNG|nr:hypothetical protein CXG81DRAFT_20951 [Caulochytrium protostelioides]|eukprot:RKO98903.1 hypothetical protein CXG81DRAFT_20951 [Caulochytrium protostelioides]
MAQEIRISLQYQRVPSAEMQESIRSGRSEADQLIAERAHRLFKGIKSNFELKLVYARRAAQNIVADDADLEELKELIRRTNNIADFTFLDDQELESASIHPVPFETYSAQKQGYRGSGSDLRSHTSLSRRNDSSFNLANSQRGHSGSHRSFIRRTAQRSSEFVYDDSAPLLGRPAISTTSIPASDANEPIPDSARTFIEKEFKNVSPGHDAETAKGTEVTPVTGSTLNNQSESDTHASEGHPDAVELSVNDDAPQSAVEEFTKVIEIPPTEEPSEDLKANEPQALPKLHVDVTVVSPESESAFTNIVFTTVDAQTSPGLPIDFDAKLADVLRKIKAPTSILKDTVNRAITTLFEENCITTASATTLPTLQQPQQNVLRRLFRPRQRVVRAPAVQVGNWGDSKPDFKFTSSSVYGGSIDEIMARDDVTTELHGVRFPTVLVDAMAILRTCGLRTKGLFRQSGGAEMVDEMISKINSGQPWSFNPNTPLLTADCIKRFYRMSREPVMTHALYETFHSVADLPTKEAQLRGLQLLVASIPKTNQQLLALFLSFCQEVLGQPLNLMSPYALAVCMGPNLLREGEFDLTGDGGAERLSRARARYAKGVAIIQLCIQDFEHLWDLPSEIAELVRLAEETGSQTSYPGLQFPGVQKRDVGKANVSSWGIHHTSVGTASPQVMSATTSTPHSPVRQVLAVATGAHGARPHGGRRFMRTLFRRRKSL